MGRIINQPFFDRIGDKIIELLNKNKDERFDKFYILTAFVKKSGISRIQEALSNFKSNGGIVKAVAGIDQRGSSREGLLLLKQLSNEAYVYHNENPSISFHPKMYIFEKKDGAIIFVGSSNLTSGGFFMNYELNSIVELDLTQKDDCKAFEEYLSVFNRYSDSTYPTCRELTDELIDELEKRGKLGVEEWPISVVPTAESGETKKAEPLFGSETFETAPLPHEKLIVAKTVKEEKVPYVETEVLEAVPNILIRTVPYASGRTSQVHFTRHIVENYFGFTLGESRHLLFQHYQLGNLGNIEKRPLVYSTANKNPKIELKGAKRLSYNYPKNGSRPILVFKKVKKDLFHYMLTMPKDDGFKELSEYLALVPQRGLSLKYDIIDKKKMLSIWPKYPM